MADLGAATLRELLAERAEQAPLDEKTRRRIQKSVVEDVVPTIQLLQAMYPTELTAHDSATEDLLSVLQAWCEDTRALRPPCKIPRNLTFSLTLPAGEPEDTEHLFQLNLDFPLHCATIDGKDPATFGAEDWDLAYASEERGVCINIRPKVRLIAPTWACRKQWDEHTSKHRSSDSGDVLEVVQQIHEDTRELLVKINSINGSSTPRETAESPSQPLVRAWFYFPSISTRTKRDDLVKQAPSWDLTGFLLAGKPGVLCLEGEAQKIDDFMRYIKTESWRDIPSQHKKVSERCRESGEHVQRHFDSMDEITNKLEKHGERSNRSDMGALETWLEMKGLGDLFERVLM